MELSEKIRSIKDYPKKGIIFRDITTLLNDKDAFKKSIDLIKKESEDLKADQIVGIEARGFIIGAALAYAMNLGFVPIRKPGKLPMETYGKEYGLEYGTDKIEMHKDAIKPGEKVLIVDDLLATGGTSKAAAEIVEEAGGIVSGFVFLIELNGLGGRELLKDYEVKSVMVFDE